MPPDKQHAVGFESDAERSRSCSQEWDEGHADDCRSLSSQKSDAGYHSSGAMSDGINHVAASSSSYDHGSYNPMSSMRSVGSTGSQGSSRGGYSALVASHLVNGETRFPTATSYASDAQRSDVATVCSGSVVEDIELESVMSADLNVQSSNHPSSPPSSVKMTIPSDNLSTASFGNINQALDAAAHAAVETVVPQKGFPVLQAQTSASSVGHHTAGPLGQQLNSSLALHNNMGPPLSRALLLRHPSHHQHQAEGNSSQAGSVKSFESNAGSDVVAHVDTDDCGGSLDMDVHSIHSQEDVNHPEGQDIARAIPPTDSGESGDDSDDNKKAVNPLLCSSEPNTNGRTSPGGTIYKGRGNRRYQGRYMHLPLKRFHQNGVDLGEDEPRQGEDGEDYRNHYVSLRSSSPRPQRNGWCNHNARDRSRSPDHHHPRERNPRERGRLLDGSSRGQSPSRSRSRSRSRERNSPQNYDGYDGRKPRGRRWQQGNDTGNPSYNNHYRGRSWGGGRNGYHPKNHAYNRSPSGRNRNRRR